MAGNKLDHLVVAAADLDTGRRYIEDLLGVETAPGGRHEAIGTHNRLLRLGDDQYLEIIAVDPDAAPPERARWFGLDEPDTRARIRDCPTLITWVARSADIERAAARAPYRDLEIRDMQRGDLRWRMTFTRDGSLLFDGALPLLIEWQTEPTPPHRLPDSGCALKQLVVQSPEGIRIQQLLRDLDIENVEVQQSAQAGLAATLSTPSRGDVLLVSAAMPEE